MSEILHPDRMHALLIVGLVVLSSFLSRFLPFFIFAKHTPRFIGFLGKVLPSAIIAMLIVYCLRGMDINNAPYGLNEIISVGVVIIIHICFKIPVLSIVFGTLCYMWLVQSEVLARFM